MRRFTRCFCLLALASLAALATADDNPPAADLPLLFSDDFEQGAAHWEPSDAKAWKIESVEGGHVYSQFVKRSDYKPPHRSPFNMALIKDLTVGDFVLTAKVKSTIPDYNHRDACLFFGYQDPGHLYYVHLGKKTDDHANQIFIVDDAPRTKISTKTTPGTNWDDQWHNVKVTRRVKDGAIKIYYDDMRNPIMTATNKKFLWGRLGVGSFDDTTQWDDIKVYGRKVAPKR